MGKKESSKKTKEEDDTPEGMSEADDVSTTEDESPQTKRTVKKSSSHKKAKKRSKSAAAESDNESEKKAMKKSTSATRESEDDDAEPENEDSDNDAVTPPKKWKKSSGSSKKQKKNSRKSKMNDSDQENNQNQDKNGKEEDEESEDENPQEYEVEKIVGDRKQNGKIQYKIHWKGYSKHQDSWEYEQNLDCPDLIEKYLSEKKKTKKKSQPQAVDGEWTVLRIIDMHTLKSGKREFLVRWKGFSEDSDTWEPEENLKDTVALDRFLVKLEKAHDASPKELRIKRKKTERLTLMSQANERKASRRNMNKQRVNYAED